MDNWEAVFKKAGNANLIEDAKASGFYAAVYKNVSDKSHPIGEIAIVYRGTDGLNDWKGWKTNFDAWRGKIPAQYDYALTFAQSVKKLYPKGPVTAAGHSRGGGQATYASQQTPGINKVVTINSARPPFADRPNSRVTQTNVIVPGEVVGDPSSGLPIGGLLPGIYVGVKLITDHKGWGAWGCHQRSEGRLRCTHRGSCPRWFSRSPRCASKCGPSSKCARDDCAQESATTSS